MANNILIIVLTLLSIIEFVIICAQKFTIFEQRHEVHEMKRWYDKQHKTFWDNR